MNIVELIKNETATLTDRTAIVEGDRTITYGELLAKIETLRATLAARGVSGGQRIAFRCADGIDYVIGALALLACNAAVVPLPDSVTADEVRDTIDRIDVQGLLAHVDFAATITTAGDRTPAPDTPVESSVSSAGPGGVERQITGQIAPDPAAVSRGAASPLPALQETEPERRLTPSPGTPGEGWGEGRPAERMTVRATTNPLPASSLPGHRMVEPEAVDAPFFFQPRTAGHAYDDRCRDLQAAFIRFSSGTTGESKGVVLSHQSIEDRTDAANAGLAVTDRDVILWVLGMSHHFVVSILLFLRKGATIIVANKGFPFSVLEAAQKYPITLIYGSPVHYYLLGVSGLVPADALSHVRLAVSTSMKMPPDVAAAFTEKFGFAPAEAYGIIEIGLPFINTEAGGAGKNTVGKALPAYELQIRNADEHGVGEVLIRGKGMFDAYFSPWRLREDCTDAGWFHTGDLGRLDDAGRLALLGRSKTVIVCAGMKVFPEEVEEVLNAVPGVRESLVFGRDHAQFGQVPVAHVVLRDETSDVLDNLRSHCCEHLSSYKVPVEFVAAESLPKTPSGKLARAAFRSST